MWLKKVVTLERSLLNKAVKGEKRRIEKEIALLESIPEEFLKSFSKAYLDLKINEYVIRRWEEIEKVSKHSKIVLYLF